jgi:hypothetical protein
MYAERDFKRGQEVTWSYGAKHNLELMYLYGFTIDKNLHDIVKLNLALQSPCLGLLLEDGRCSFDLDMMQVNQAMLSTMKGEVAWKLQDAQQVSEEQMAVAAALKYRSSYMVAVRSLKHSVRTLRRLLKTELSLRERLALQFLLSECLSIHQHLTIADRASLKALIAVLDLALMP